MAERLYRGRCSRVLTPNLVEVDIDLGLGVHITRRMVLGHYRVTDGAGDTAMHCLVILVGGKTVLVRVDDETIDGHMRGTVYSCETKFAGVPNIPTQQTEFGPVRDVVDWMTWSADNGHNPKMMRAAVKD